MHCSSCQAEIPAHVQHCPECGAPASGRTDGGHQRAPRQHDTAQLTRLVADLPVVGGAIYGLVAYVLGLFAVALLLWHDLSSSKILSVYAGDQSGKALLGALGWSFYGAHTVQLTTSLPRGSFNMLEAVYAVISQPLVPKLVIYLVPILVLVVAGRSLAARTTVPGATVVDSVRAGATVTVGYLTLTVASTLTVFSYTASDVALTIKPEFGPAVVMMGIVYPAVFGGLGGYLATR